ncbi:PXA domain-containing protein [Peziza echinospora]|nr:PXA domain-containing protein [Peziza echinospora]
MADIHETTPDSSTAGKEEPRREETGPAFQVLVNGVEPAHADPDNDGKTAAALSQLTVETGLGPGVPAALPSPLSPAFAAGVEQLSNHGIQFLATASPEILGGVIVGSTLVLYFIFGRLVLFVAGVLVGVLVHSAWETQRRKEAGDSAGPNPIKLTTNGNDTVEVYSRPTFSTLPTATAAALEELTQSIVTGCIRFWYSPLLPGEDAFPRSCKEVLTNTLVNIHNQVSQKRPTDTLILFLTSTSNILIVFFRELSTALGGAGTTSSPGAAIGTFVEDHPSSALAQLLDQDVQKRKLHSAAEDLVQTFVERKVMQCGPVRTFMQEILAGMVLKMAVEKCSEADWINEWIIYLLKEEEVKESVSSNGSTRVSIDEEPSKEGSQSGDRLDKLLPNSNQQTREAEQKEKDRKKEARISKAEEAMQQAMREAEELTRMIEEEERKKRSGELEREEPATQSPPPRSIISPKLSAELRDVPTPLRSRANSVAQQPIAAPPRPASLQRTFTSFDQIVQAANPPAPPGPQDCLHKAYVTLADLSPASYNSTEEAPIRSKPVTTLYMLQIEPHSSYSIPGWILTRKYTDFEGLHEALVRLAVISGADNFANNHSDLPTWKGGVTADQLRQNLEIYINAALREPALAQCDSIKRFLDKDSAMLEDTASTNTGNALTNLTKGWSKPKAFKNIGDNVLDALTKGPQEAALGGKAFFGGVFNNVGGMRKSQGLLNKAPNGGTVPDERKPLPMGLYSPPNTSGEKGHVEVIEGGWVPKEDPEGRNGNGVKGEAANGGNNYDEYFGSDGDFDDWVPRARSRPDNRKTVGGEIGHRRGRASQDSIIPPRSSSSGWKSHSRHNSAFSHETATRSMPPMPMDLPDDFLDMKSVLEFRPPLPPRVSTIAELPTIGNTAESEGRSSLSELRHSLDDLAQDVQMTNSQTLKNTITRTESSHNGSLASSQTMTKPTTEQETQLIVEMLFAILSELFTLSSAWLLRRSLLNVAKNILLRPGNTSLEATRLLIQETLIDGNTSDKAIAHHISKLRKNIFPTPQELEQWEAKKRELEKDVASSGERRSEVRREEARRLLLEKGMPEALKGVMGQAACRESLGRVFDSLQVKSVARGLVCGLVLEVVRGVCQ